MDSKLSRIAGHERSRNLQAKSRAERGVRGKCRYILDGDHPLRRDRFCFSNHTKRNSHLAIVSFCSDNRSTDPLNSVAF